MFDAQFVVNLIFSGASYALVALGIVLVFSIMRVINFSHGAMYMLGAFAAYYVVVAFGQSYVLAILIAAVGVGSLGIVLERGIFRPLRGKGLSSLIASLGVMLTIEGSALLAFGSYTKGLDVFDGSLRAAGVVLPVERLFVIIISLALIVGLNYFIKNAKQGQAMRALAQNRESAILQGVPVNRISGLALAIGSGLAGIAGALMAPVFTVAYYMGSGVIFKAFMVIIIGGLGSVPGALIGGFLLGAIENIGYTVIPGGWTTMVTVAVILIFMLLRPKGIMGREVRL